MFGLLKKSTSEKVSNYNVIVEHKDGFVFYNQISGSLLLLNEDQFNQYRKLLKRNFSIDADLLEELRENKFIIAEDFDEIDYMNKTYKKKKHKSYNKTLTIVPTDKCNLGCFYCYEDKSQWKNMSIETIEQTKKFVETFLLTTPTNQFLVTWFGGEPTLNLSCVEDLSSFFNDVCNKNKIVYGQSMVTNGTNINEKVIERLCKINCKNLQITIDGYKEDHDESRPFLSDLSIEEMSNVQIEQRRKINPGFGKFLNIIGQEPIQKKKRSTYDLIINNLKLMHENGFNISLRCNIGSHNMKNHHKLLSNLEELGLTKTNEKNGGLISPYVAQIFSHTGNSELSDISRESFSKFEIESGKSCEKSPVLTSFSGESCMANKQYSLCISQSGKISKCWHHATNDEYVIGSVSDLDIAKNGFVDDYAPFDDYECLSCYVLPSCMGGCKESNHFYQKGYKGKKLEGCQTLRWNIRSRVVELYENFKKNANKC